MAVIKEKKNISGNVDTYFPNVLNLILILVIIILKDYCALPQNTDWETSPRHAGISFDE